MHTHLQAMTHVRAEEASFPEAGGAQAGAETARCAPASREVLECVPGEFDTSSEL